MKRLGLHEWVSRTTFRLAPIEDLGNTRWFAEERTAEVLVNPKQTPPEIINTLIHELLHLALEGHRIEIAKYDASYELGLNRISNALLKEWYSSIE
jgi:hypothetical protein